MLLMSSFQHEAFTNCAAVCVTNVLLFVCWSTCARVSLVHIPRCEIADLQNMGIFNQMADFSQVIEPVYIPNCSVWECPLIQQVELLDFYIFTSLEVIIFICNTLIIREFEHLFNMFIDHLNFHFYDVAIRVSWLFFCWLMVIIYSGYLYFIGPWQLIQY